METSEKILNALKINKPVQIENREWWFKGRIIQENNHPFLPRFISFRDSNGSYLTEVHGSFKDAVKYCKEHPNLEPKNIPSDYL